MSAATSPGTGLAYGAARVCAAWDFARSSFYALKSRQHATAERRPAKRRGPKPSISDQALLVAIEADLEASPWEGEGHRKVWARLRVCRGIRVARKRVLRVMRENNLRLPRRGGNPHDGEVVLRLLRGEPMELMSRQFGVEIFRLEQWRETRQSHAQGTDRPWPHLSQHRRAAGRRPRVRQTVQCPVDRGEEPLLEPRSSPSGVARHDVTQARRLRQTCVQGTGCDTRRFFQTGYQAKSWSRERKVVARVEATARGTDVRFVVTNLPGRAKLLYERVYCARGRMENMIKEHKLYTKSDRTSCHRWEANQFRLFLHTAASWLLHQLRRTAPRRSPWRTATFETLRRAFLKIAVRIEELNTRIKIALPSAYPYRNALIAMAASIAAQGP